MVAGKMRFWEAPDSLKKFFMGLSASIFSGHPERSESASGVEGSRAILRAQSIIPKYWLQLSVTRLLP
jgi:hypothetical protein